MYKYAQISEDGRYRYVLTRRWGAGATVAWIMLNPSAADAEVDDPTIRRVIGFSKREGFGQAVVLNLFAFRTPEPSELAATADPVGPENDKILARFGGPNPHVTIAAWGAHYIARERWTAIAPWFEDMQLFCLGTTKSGAPRHPLYLRRDTPLVPWISPTTRVGQASSQNAASSNSEAP